jgi:hypothetical protein
MISSVLMRVGGLCRSHQAAIGTPRAIPPEILTLKTTTTPDHTTKPATADLPTLHASPHPPHTHAPHYQAQNPHKNSTVQEEEEEEEKIH